MRFRWVVKNIARPIKCICWSKETGKKTQTIILHTEVRLAIILSVENSPRFLTLHEAESVLFRAGWQVRKTAARSSVMPCSFPLCALEDLWKWHLEPDSMTLRSLWLQVILEKALKGWMCSVKPYKPQTRPLRLPSGAWVCGSKGGKGLSFMSVIMSRSCCTGVHVVFTFDLTVTLASWLQKPGFVFHYFLLWFVEDRIL